MHYFQHSGLPITLVPNFLWLEVEVTRIRMMRQRQDRVGATAMAKEDAHSLRE